MTDSGSSILDPSFSFELLSKAMESTGWRTISVAANPLVPGEPEHATFERNDAERLYYTFNPVCRLRVLELPESLAEVILDSLPVTHASNVATWLASGDERTLLRGVLAARLLKTYHLRPQLEALQSHPRAAISRAAAQAAETLSQARDAVGGPDAGELVHRFGELRRSLVESRASASANPEAWTAAIGESLDLLDQIEAKFPPGADQLDSDALTSPLGRAVFIAAPECFQRTWISSQRQSLNSMKTCPENSQESQARATALTAIEVLRAQVTPLLLAISHDRTGEALKAVRPREEDFAKAFAPAVADAARQAYSPIWGSDPKSLDMRYPDPAQTVLTCDLAPAGMLAYDNELSLRFPGGYRGIAHLLDPRRVWARWKCVRPGEATGMAYDGLVWLDDHWAWFPKPYRVLAGLVP